MSTNQADVIDTRDMVVVHTAFRREFGLAPALVRGVAPGDQKRADVVADHLDTLTAMLHHHHAGEDRLLWPKLHERVPADIAPVVTLMEEQHHRIHAANDRVGEDLASWRQGASAEARDALAVSLEEVDAALVEHLTAEEEQLLPIAAANLTPAEWEQLGEEGMAGLRKSQLPLVFGMLQYQGDPEVIAMMLSHAPGPGTAAHAVPRAAGVREVLPPGARHRHPLRNRTPRLTADQSPRSPSIRLSSGLASRHESIPVPGPRWAARRRRWVIWTLQGLDVLGGSAMSGVTFWAFVGPLVALGGILLIVLSRRGGSSSS